MDWMVQCLYIYMYVYGTADVSAPVLLQVVVVETAWACQLLGLAFVLMSDREMFVYLDSTNMVPQEVLCAA